MYLRFKALLTVLVLAALVVLIAPHSEVMAGADMSEGCAYLRANGDLSPYHVAGNLIFGYRGEFWAGETITVTNAIPVTASNTMLLSVWGTIIFDEHGNAPYSTSYVIPDSEIYIVTLRTPDGFSSGTVSCTPLQQQSPEPVNPVKPAAPANVPFVPGDDRFNHDDADRAAPVAFYCSADGIEFIRIDPTSGEGTDTVKVDAAALTKGDGRATLLKTDWVIISQLEDGSFQVNAWYADGKPYTFSWQECSAASIVYLER